MAGKKKDPHAVALGKKGGAARREALTARERSVIARMGAKARWEKKGK